MSETPPQASDTPTNVNDSPGELLARRREQLGIALNDAARALNLRPAVVDGLERDDYSEIPVVTYRRGYLRAYAKYLELDERKILEAYRERFGEADVERKVTPVAVTKPPSRLGAWLFKLVTLLVIVALIAVTVMWWQSRGGSELPNLDSSSSMDAPADQNQAGDLSSEPTQTESAVPSSAHEEEAPTFDDLVAEDDTSTAQTSLDAESTADDISETTSNDTSSTEPESAPLVDGDEAAQTNNLAATDSEDDDSNNDGGNNDANPNLLTLTFNEQSWTEIIDADNQRVLVGLQEPGTSASVEGQPPFRLTVGNVTGVEMRYQGEDVDLTSRAGANNVARFTLGE